MKKLVFVPLALIILVSCNTLRDLANVQKPSVRYSSMSVEDFSFRDVTLLFDFEVTNPNSFGVSADQYQYEFFINGEEFITGIQRENISIASQSKSIIQIPVSLAFSEVFKTIGSVVNQDSIEYRISSEVEFDVARIGRQRVPVSTTGHLPIPRLPQIEFADLEIRELSLSVAEMVASFRIKNPNTFGISLSNAAYVLEVNSYPWFETTIDRNIWLNESGSELISIPIRLNSSQMGSVLMEMLRGETEFNYHLSGSAQISADIKGFSGFETISFDRTGTYSMD